MNKMFQAVRRDLKAWNIKEEWATDREKDGKVSARHATSIRETAAKGEKVRKKMH